MEKIIEKKNLSNHLETSSSGEKTSLLSSAIFFFLNLILIFSGVAFGAVDVWSFGVLAIFACVIGILWCADSWQKKEFRFSANPLQVPLIGLIVIGCVQLLPLRNTAKLSELLNIPAVSALSFDPYSTRFFVIQLLVYLIFFAAALAFINTQKRLRSIVLTVIVFGGLMAFFGILQRLASPDAIYGLRPTPQAIPFASFINQHHFAAFMNMTLGLTLGLLFGKATKKDKNILLVIAAFFMLIGLVFTGSRGGILSFLGVLGFLLIPKLLGKGEESEAQNKHNVRNKLIIVAGIAAGIIGLVGVVSFLGGDSSLLRGVGLQGGQTDISSGRTHFWGVAVQIFLANPIIGAGLNAFGAAFTQYDTWNGNYRIEQAHNDYLQILADAGVVGFACIAGFIYLLFKKSLPNLDSAHSNYRRSAANGALAGCFGILIHSFFDFPLRTPSNAFFFLVLAAVATVSIYYPKQTKHKSRTENRA